MTQTTQRQADLRAYLLKWRERFSEVGKGGYMVAHVDRMLADNPESLEEYWLDALEKKKYYKDNAKHGLDLDYTYWLSCSGYIGMMHNMYETYGCFEEMPSGM